MGNVKGVYILILSVGKDISVNVGALGRLDLKRGQYAYVGSAQSNLEKRVERHFKKDKRRFWHIDYLLYDDNVGVSRIFYETARRSEECRIARELSNRGLPIEGFGSSILLSLLW
jgi:Uri superfamily endonuclease